MKSLSRIAAVLVGLLAAACSTPPTSGPPEIAYGEQECAGCRMIVSEARYAAAIETADGELMVFDDLACLLDWTRGRDTETIRAWVHDVDDESWLEAERAVYGLEPGRITPMGSGWTARARVDAPDGAGDLAREGEPSEVELLTWPELIEDFEVRSTSPS